MTRREKREERRKLRDPYYAEECRLNLMLSALEPGTECYDRISQELRQINQMRGESRESKRRISKEHKGSIIIKVLSMLGAGAGLASIIWAERQGLTFTGEKRSVMDAISRGIGNVFVKKG